MHPGPLPWQRGAYSSVQSTPMLGGARGFKYAATFMVRALQNLELVVIPVSSRALCSNLSPLSPKKEKKKKKHKKTITSHSRSQSLDITEQDSGSRGKEARREAAYPRTRPARRPVYSCCADASKRKRKKEKKKTDALFFSVSALV